MNYSVATIYLLIIFGFLELGCSTIKSSTHENNWTSGEIRGVWLTNIDSEVMFTRQNIQVGIKRLADAGFNVVYPVVYNDGYTMYPSNVMVKYFGEANRQDSVFVANSIDPLAEIVREAKKYNLKVIPWFEFGFSSSYNPPDNILAKYPQWAGRDRDGNILKKNGFTWLNGFHPEVQQFVLELIQEVIERYKVDGIQGDDRLPALPSSGGYDDYTVSVYRKEHNGENPPYDYKNPSWLKWRADKLSDFGGRLYQMVKTHNPNLIVSLSPSIYPWSLEEYLQDWPEWIRRGQVDMVHPQAYRYEIERYKNTIDEMIRESGLDLKARKIILAPGILIKAGPRFNDPTYVKQALRYNREKGLHGEVFFFYEGLFEQNQYLADSLRASFYKKSVLFPRK
ncbi:MAG TPA: family 10 glycosylhydrolase [Rhodothermales bacterium]|nr:family 10 glycosylhydrolase [Rhodothermales bacterium]